MTLRTLTTSQEARFSLVFFEIDETYSIVETRKLQVLTSGAERIRASKVQVKIGRQMFEAEIVEQSNSQNDLEKHLANIETVSNSTTSDQQQPNEATPSSQSSVDKNTLEKDDASKKKMTRKRKRNNNPKVDKTKKQKENVS